MQGFGMGKAIALSDNKGDRNAGIRHGIRAIALSENKGDSLRDSFASPPLGFDMEKARSMHGCLGEKGILHFL
ncbi:hypothetical protein IQ269_05530 [Tychonema sp. LEGE 07199]|uniref:hypothetical protein n=1 Tax=unclassified Tychonema TaxID=2642144 RepID=UPI0018830E36|nr:MULTISPECIES: hypothetical protein [unclassified Tychonema]MBE9120284.1 hypothetical protein [Tychonema sp. LEGE 07199]MBE9131058.1 hypothetical protein [Tychonema sp. LEGE 07196]